MTAAMTMAMYFCSVNATIRNAPEAHDRGQDLTAGGGNGLNAAGELGLVAGLHQRKW